MDKQKDGFYSICNTQFTVNCCLYSVLKLLDLVKSFNLCKHLKQHAHLVDPL